MASLIPPIWFDEALLLKARGLDNRETAKVLKERGFRANHQDVWYWTTAQGFRRLKFIKRTK